jgi:hypothetical protein
MYCTTCKEFFKPTPEEERLIAIGKLEMLCIKCAAAEWTEKSRTQVLAPPIYPGVRQHTSTDKASGTHIRRVEWYHPDGKLILFISLPPRPIKHPVHIISPRKVEMVHVTPMSNEALLNTRRFPSNPSLHIRTNLESPDQPMFWVRKTPGGCDDVTGMDGIELSRARIKNVERVDLTATITLDDQSYIRIFYF